MDKKKIRFLKSLSTGMVIVAIIFAFLIAGIRIFGVQVYGVLTGSMEPNYPTGSLIYVKRVDASDLRVNDVITFSISPNVIATHRIVEIVPDESNPSVLYYRTKGDANQDVDASLVSASNIIGKVIFAVPKMGYIANYIQNPPGIYVAILICGLMIAFVFYTDSLESKPKSFFQRNNKRRHYVPPRQPGAQQRMNSRPGAHPRQGAYPRRDGNARPGRYLQRREYPQENEPRQQRTYPQRYGAPQRRTYSNSRDRGTGRM